MKHCLVRPIGTLLLLLVGMCLTLSAQDGLNLPTDLYVLTNEGAIQKYGLGIQGISQVSADGTFVLDMAVAPDNISLAYRTAEGMFLAQAESVTQIEGLSASYPEIRGQGDTIAWSPDGNALAYTTLGNGRVFVRQAGSLVEGIFQDLGTAGLQDVRWSPRGTYLAMGAQGNIWWVYRREGDSFRLVSALPDATGIAWRSDDSLYFTPASGGVFLMELASNNAQTGILRATTRYSLPFTQGETLLVYQGEPTAARLLSITGLQPLNLGTADVNISAMRWAPDGKSLVAYSGGALALVDPISGEGFTLPINNATHYTWGAYTPSDETLSGWQALTMLATAPFAESDAPRRVWQVEETGIPITLAPTDESIDTYTLSGDARRLAYTANETLYFYILGGGADTLYTLTEGVGQMTTPTFSTDGLRLYFNTPDEPAAISFSDLGSGQVYPFFSSTEGVVGTPAVSASIGALLLSGSASDVPSVLLDAVTAEVLRTFAGKSTWLTGTQIITVGSNGERATLTLFDATVNSDGTERLLYTAEAGASIVDVALLDAETLRVLITRQPLTPPQVWDVTLATGSAQQVPMPGFLLDVGMLHLSADARWLVGVTMPNRELTVVEIASGRRRLPAPNMRVYQAQFVR